MTVPWKLIGEEPTGHSLSKRHGTSVQNVSNTSNFPYVPIQFVEELLGESLADTVAQTANQTVDMIIDTLSTVLSTTGIADSVATNIADAVSSSIGPNVSSAVDNIVDNATASINFAAINNISNILDNARSVQSRQNWADIVAVISNAINDHSGLALAPLTSPVISGRAIEVNDESERRPIQPRQNFDAIIALFDKLIPILAPRNYIPTLTRRSAGNDELEKHSIQSRQNIDAIFSFLGNAFGIVLEPLVNALVGSG